MRYTKHFNVDLSVLNMAQSARFNSEPLLSQFQFTNETSTDKPTTNDNREQHSTTVSRRHRIRRKKLYTPAEWTERMQHYIKRIHNVDIKQISVETVPIVKDGTRKTQKSDKTSSRTPDRQQSK